MREQHLRRYLTGFAWTGATTTCPASPSSGCERSRSAWMASDSPITPSLRRASVCKRAHLRRVQCLDDFDTAQHRRARPQDRRAQTRANAISARLMTGVAPGPTLDSDILTSVLSEVSRVPANFEPIQRIPAHREAISTRIRRRTKINTGKEGRFSLNPVCEGTSADLTGATRQMGHHCKATG